MKFFTGARLIFSSLIFVGLVLGMQACGGGGGGAAAPLGDQDGSGIYSGTATVDVNTNITDLRGIIYNNRFMFFSLTATPHVLYDGTITSIDKDNYTATVNVYESGVLTAAKTGIAVIGKILTSNKITGTIGTEGAAGNENGTFTLNYSNQYERAGTTARIEASFFDRATGTTYGRTNETTDKFGFRTDLTFLVASTNCTITGESYVIPDATVNIYTLDNIDIIDTGGSACLPAEYKGSGFSGLVSVIDASAGEGGGTDNRILIAYTNGSSSVFGYLTKLSPP